MSDAPKPLTDADLARMEAHPQLNVALNLGTLHKDDADSVLGECWVAQFCNESFPRDTTWMHKEEVEALAAAPAIRADLDLAVAEIRRLREAFARVEPYICVSCCRLCETPGEAERCCTSKSGVDWFKPTREERDAAKARIRVLEEALLAERPHDGLHTDGCLNALSADPECGFCRCPYGDRRDRIDAVLKRGAK